MGNHKQFLRKRIQCNELYRRLMTFTFTMDAFPGYVRGDQTTKVLAVIDIMDEREGADTVKTYRTATVQN